MYKIRSSTLQILYNVHDNFEELTETLFIEIGIKHILKHTYFVCRYFKVPGKIRQNLSKD